MAKMFREREPQIIDESSLKFVSVLGRGGYGSVTLMRDSNLRLFAEKSSSFDDLRSLEKEHRIMQRFHDHPRIVQTRSPNLHIETNPERCYIYMEFASKGTLHNMISEFRERGRPMPENTIGHVALMILQGLQALHSHGYVHCDLKPANVLVFPSKAVGEPWDLKLADFGMSKEPCTDSRSLLAGTKPYMPPETLGPNKVIGSAVDVWSLGCVVLEMFGGCPKKMGHCYTWRLPKIVSPMADDFLKRCLALLPSRRATVEELLKHPFVAQKVIGVTPRRESTGPCPSVTRNSVMEDCSRRQRGGPMMKMMPRPQDLIY
ncbi:unnamed protein product [Microthlaspi erraticum]|uniref:Protein kinase domain-containing protein n=1 Tax=Microthlaspi erraticum TaxID=1685480 RepID=A0A6D2HQU3_9BRAS|nr:unnamed protein product [Microthlaspi erraticum]